MPIWRPRVAQTDFSQIEEKIGYTFRDKRLLETAFTHASYAGETGTESNERLEFLGDALLGFLVADALFRAGGEDEGEMTARRIRLVSAEPLEGAVRAMGLEKYLRISAGMRGDPGKKAVSSLFEALVAAVYLDGGMEPARQFVAAHLSLAAQAEPNYKGDLQEYLQGRHLPRAVYEVTGRRGEPPETRFTVRASAAGKSAVGGGATIRAAEKAAAKALLSALISQGE